MARVPPRQSFGNLFGGRGQRSLPPIVLVLMIATALASIVGIVGARHGFPLLEACVLLPPMVLHGQAWRLFTWVFFETDPWSLAMGCYVLYWIGRDLAARWSTVQFVVVYLGLAAVIGGLTVAASLVYPPLKLIPHAGGWALLDALVIFWASYYPTQQIFMMFVLPMSGRRIMAFTVGVTVLLALFKGIEGYIPNFLAEAVALAVVFLPSPRDWWIELKLRGMEQRRKATHLHSVPRDSASHDDTPPGPPGGDRPSNGRWLN